MVDDMGIFRTSVAIAPLAPAPHSRVIDHVMVDTGAEYSAFPRPLLEEIGIVPVRTERFEAADGRVFERHVGFALVGAGGRVGPTVVMFGEPGDTTLLGAHGLEALNLRIDLVRRELVPAGPAPAAAVA